MDSGIKSIRDTVNMTPAEKARANVISLSLFLIGNKTGIIPIKVESPARVVITNAIVSPTFTYASILRDITLYVKIVKAEVVYEL